MGTRLRCATPRKAGSGSRNALHTVHTFDTLHTYYTLNTFYTGRVGGGYRNIIHI